MRKDNMDIDKRDALVESRQIECFNKRDFIVEEKHESNIRIGHYHRVDVGLKCPMCDSVSEIIKHGYTDDCNNCGLIMTVYGNALYAQKTSSNKIDNIFSFVDNLFK